MRGWGYLPTSLLLLHLDENIYMEIIPAELAMLTNLVRLSLKHNNIVGGWEHLPRQLRQLDCTSAAGIDSMHLPAALANLKQLEHLDLESISVEDGWHLLPKQLLSLNLNACGLSGRVPPELATLTQLTWLDLRRNGLFGDSEWKHLPPQLEELWLDEVPAELSERGIDIFV